MGGGGGGGEYLKIFPFSATQNTDSGLYLIHAVYMTGVEINMALLLKTTNDRLRW